MTSPGQIECGSELYQQWCKDDRYEILVVETPRPGVYRFTPRLRGLVRGTTLAHNQEQAGATPAPVTNSPCEAESSLVAPPANPSQPEEADNLFGNASPPTPSGVASPSPQETRANVPAGNLSHRIELLPADVADFLLRVRRMEIAITGQMPHPDGRHTIFEYVDAKSMPKTETNAPAAKPEPLKVLCAFCQGPLEEDGTCKICEIGESIFAKARANRKAYHEKKKACL